MTTRHTLTDVELLEQDPRASEAIEAGVCGRGLTQPGWPACHRDGTWWVSRPSGQPFDHAYCAEHAARRLRNVDYLSATAAWSTTQRFQGSRAGR